MGLTTFLLLLGFTVAKLGLAAAIVVHGLSRPDGMGGAPTDDRDDPPNLPRPPRDPRRERVRRGAHERRRPRVRRRRERA